MLGGTGKTGRRVEAQRQARDQATLIISARQSRRLAQRREKARWQLADVLAAFEGTTYRSVVQRGA